MRTRTPKTGKWSEEWRNRREAVIRNHCKYNGGCSPNMLLGALSRAMSTHRCDHPDWICWGLNGVRCIVCGATASYTQATPAW